MKHKTHTEEETSELASTFAQTLKGEDVIYLQGELGSGKTAFVRGVVRALGFHDPVRSPTFTIVNRYPIEHPTISQVLHVDLYRIEDPSEIPPLALEEQMGLPGTVTFIEWPECGQGTLSAPTHQITFATQGDSHIIEII